MRRLVGSGLRKVVAGTPGNAQDGVVSLTAIGVSNAFSVTTVQSRALASYGGVTNEDRRWWMVHLECSPDVNAGTFCSWLDSCGTHTTKKLVERNIWTIEQVAALSSDQIDHLRYKEGCIHMDVVWEHARTILPALKARETGQGVESQLQEKILELRKKRELQRRKEEILKDRADTAAEREKALQEMRERLAKKREELRLRQQAFAREKGGLSPDSENSTGVAEGVKRAAEELGGKP
jgi:hypothetical protein